jgi:hypothetical protein
MEIDEQSDFEPTKFQVRKDLGFKNGVHFLDCFQFDNDHALNQQINSVTGGLKSFLLTAEVAEGRRDRSKVSKSLRNSAFSAVSYPW